jgi:hypothetical protein
MWKVKLTCLVFLTIFAAAALGGCATKDPWFHGNYPDFQPGPKGGADLIEIKEGVDHTKYKFIFMESVSFHYESTTQYNAVPPEVREDLGKAFNSAFTEALGNAYPIVDKPRPEALWVRVAITGIVPIIHAADPSHPPVSVGGASMKAEILDSWTKERVGAVIDSKKGNMQNWAQRLRSWLDRTHSRQKLR